MSVFGWLLVLAAVGGHPDHRVEGVREQVRRALRRPDPKLGLLHRVRAASFTEGNAPEVACSLASPARRVFAALAVGRRAAYNGDIS